MISRSMVVLACIDRYALSSPSERLRSFSLHIPFLLTIQFGRCSTFGMYSIIYSVYSFLVDGIFPPMLIRINDNENQFRIKRQDYNLIVMLMWEVIIYLISTISYPIQTLYLTITNRLNKSILRLQIESFITCLAYSFLIYINSSASFYIYFNTSRTFRQELNAMLYQYDRSMLSHRWLYK